MFPVSICLFMFLQRREKPLMQLPQKSRCQRFGAVPSVPVFCFSCLSSPSRLMLHFAFPRCIRRVKEWSEHIRGNPLFAWWTYLFTPGSSHLEVITAPLSQPLITGFVVQSRSFKSSQLERLYLPVLPSPPLDQWEIALLNTFFDWLCGGVFWESGAAPRRLADDFRQLRWSSDSCLVHGFSSRGHCGGELSGPAPAPAAPPRREQERC